MKAFALVLALFLAAASAFIVPSQRLTTPRNNAVTSASARSARGARSTMTMKVLPPSKKSEENDRLRTLEADSERWFQEQERREANGELGWLENPAFYTAIFFLCPLVILVGGAATGIIPGFVQNSYEYSTLEEVKSSLSYGELTQAAEYASGASSLF